MILGMLLAFRIIWRFRALAPSRRSQPAQP
jgi:hypothetical protein